MKRGFFITFEGGEGSGKSIQVEILASHLHEEGHAVVVTREPGGTRVGEQIRTITHDTENVDLEAITEAYLMAASRAQHVSQLIEPAIESGKIVVCDRYVDSSIAYQGYGRKLGAEVIEKLNELAVNGAIPDLTILLDVPIGIGLARRAKSRKLKDRLDLQEKTFYERVNQGYRDLARVHPDQFVIIDATKSIEAVGSEVWSVVKDRLALNEKQKR